MGLLTRLSGSRDVTVLKKRCYCSTRRVVCPQLLVLQMRPGSDDCGCTNFAKSVGQAARCAGCCWGSCTSSWPVRSCKISSIRGDACSPGVLTLPALLPWAPDLHHPQYHLCHQLLGWSRHDQACLASKQDVPHMCCTVNGVV